MTYLGSKNSQANFVTIERTIVDWFEANGFQVTCSAAEWFFDDSDMNFSLSELANAVAAQLSDTHRPEGK